MNPIARSLYTPFPESNTGSETLLTITTSVSFIFCGITFIDADSTASRARLDCDESLFCDVIDITFVLVGFSAEICDSKSEGLTFASRDFAASFIIAVPVSSSIQSIGFTAISVFSPAYTGSILYTIIFAVEE